MLSRFYHRIVRGQGSGNVILRTVLVSMATRGFSIIASLLTVPLVLHHVGHERYGIWMAGIAVSTLFTMADGGVTKGLIGEVAKAHGAGDRARVRVLIASGMAATLMILALFLAVMFLVVSNINWTWAFNLSDASMGREAAAVITTICLCYALSFPPTVIREARLGLLQGASVNAWDLAGVILAFGGLLVAIKFGAGLAMIAAIWAGTPVLVRSISAIIFLAGQGRDLLPTWRDVEPRVGRAMIASGGVFMLYTLTQALSVQSDQVLIARFVGAAAVTDYAVVQRLFNQPQVLVMLGLAAQWPAYGEAMGRGDSEWIRRHFLKSLMGYGVFAVVTSGALALFCNPILKVWVGGVVTAPPSLIIAMAICSVVATVANVFAFFFMSLGLHRRLIVAQIVMIGVSLPLSLLLIPKLGAGGAVVAMALGYLVAHVVPGLLTLNRMFANLRISTHTVAPVI